MATLRDVARRASVSVTTASRALNGHSDVNEQTRAAVVVASQDLDYHPSDAARSLVLGRTYMLGIHFVTSVERVFVSPLITQVIHTFAAEVAAHDYDILWLTAETETLRAENLVTRARRRQVEGVFSLVFNPDEPALSEIAHLQLPVVMFDMDRVGPNARFVASDHAAGGHLAVDHLTQLGHRDLGLMVAMTGSLAGRERLLGFREALMEHGLTYRPEWVEVTEDYDVASGYRAMQALLARWGDGPRPTALFVGGDDLAIGAIRALRAAGIGVPTDLSVVGFDDLPQAGVVTPGLTTVRQDVDRIGRTCGRLLVQAVQDHSIPDVPRIPVSLTVRESTAPLRAH